MTQDVRVHEQRPPDERLGRIAGRLLEALEADSEYVEGDRLIVGLTEAGKDAAAMSATFGYEQESAIEDAAGDLFQHLRALLAGRGIDVQMEHRDSQATIVHGEHPRLPSSSGAAVTVTITDRNDGITALIESKPPLPMTNDFPDLDRVSNAQAAALHMLWQIGEQTRDFDWRVVLRKDLP